MADANRPNILWICTDQQRWDTLGVTGNEHVRTPNIDRLAAEGVQFDRAYCQSPVCSPSRASFLTGRYPRTTGVRQNGQNIPESETLVTRHLADAGYVCGLSGKLHLSACNPSVCTDMERRIDDGYAAFHWSHHPKPDWPGSEYGAWLRERGVEFATPMREDSGHVHHGMPAAHHQTTWCAQKAIDFIEHHTSDPWLFSVNIFDPHFPFDPPDEYLAPYLERLDDIPLPTAAQGKLSARPHFQQPSVRETYGFVGPHHVDQMSETDHRMCRAAYWAMCDLIDVEVGRMLSCLEQTGQRDNTIVLFMSDHGEMLGDQDLYYKGPFFYDAAVRVPLIVSWPGRFNPRRSDALVELTDLAPTLLEAAGLPRGAGMQGESMLSLLRGDVETHRQDVYCEYYNAMRSGDEPPAFATMLFDGRHKLVVAHGFEVGELYDLQRDPDELHNLWDDPGRLDVKAQLLKRLTDRMAATSDPLPERIAIY